MRGSSTGPRGSWLRARVRALEGAGSLPSLWPLPPKPQTQGLQRGLLACGLLACTLAELPFLN